MDHPGRSIIGSFKMKPNIKIYLLTQHDLIDSNSI